MASAAEPFPGRSQAGVYGSQTRCSFRRSARELTQDLHFDVSGLFDKPLDKKRAVAKRRQGLRVRPLVVLLQFLQEKQTHSPQLFSSAAFPDAPIQDGRHNLALPAIPRVSHPLFASPPRPPDEPRSSRRAPRGPVLLKVVTPAVTAATPGRLGLWRRARLDRNAVGDRFKQPFGSF